MAYDGQYMTSSGEVPIDLSRATVIAVSGSGPNVCGHLLLRASGGGGHYFHVAGIHDYPKYMNEQGFKRYLKENGKTVLRRVPVSIPDPDAARLHLENLMSRKWTWLVLPNNCVAFVEDVIASGGGTWASASNCPALATAPTIQQRINDFLNRAEREIRHRYGVPGF